MVPVITVITSVIVLEEKITGIALLGTALTLAGLLISENKITIRTKRRLKNE
jgi:drug/metabolite transporter (DMT)-like permease